MYAGESHDRRIFIVRQGKIVWSYDDPAGKGEISDAVILSNGNVLYAHQFGVTRLLRKRKSFGIMMLPLGTKSIPRYQSEKSTFCTFRMAIRR